MKKFLPKVAFVVILISSLFLNVNESYGQCNGVSGGTGNGDTISTLPACNATTANVNVPHSGYVTLSNLEIGGKYTVNLGGGTGANYITVRTAVSGGTVTGFCTSCTSYTFIATATTHYVVVNQNGCPGTWNTSSATLNYKRENPTASTISVTYNCTNTVLNSSGGEGNYQWQASNGTSISGATNLSYTITSSTTPQYSAYRLRRARGTCYSYSSNLNVVPRANFTGNVVVSSNGTLAGTYNFNGNFTINSGVTVTVPVGCELHVEANNITIAGTINANGTGNAASSGGAGGTGYGGLGCDVNSQAYTAAGVKASSNGSGTGGGKAASSNGSNGVGCGQDLQLALFRPLNVSLKLS